MKVTLYCEGAYVSCARNQEDERLFREQIHGREIDLAYMPNVGESISLFVERGRIEFTIVARGITHAFEDSQMNTAEKTIYGLWAKKLTIMRHNASN